MPSPATGYAPVNDLEMYYEIHGDGPPLLMLHGAYQTVESMGPLLPALAKIRRVIGTEQQAHGHTGDADRPITYEQMADDNAALMRHLGIDKADVFGFSMGGAIALQMAVRHPDLVRKVVVASAGYRSDGMPQELIDMFPSITPEMFAGTPMEEEYQRTSPNPGDFPKLVEKLKQLDMTPFAWPDDDIQSITAPMMVLLGDSDGLTLEHAVKLFRLLGGGIMGDLVGLPRSQLVVLPGTTHFMPFGFGLLDRTEWFMPMVTAFLDAPVTE